MLFWPTIATSVPFQVMAIVSVVVMVVSLGVVSSVVVSSSVGSVGVFFSVQAIIPMVSRNTKLTPAIGLIVKFIFF